MNVLTIALAIFVGLMLLANIVATYYVVVGELSDRRQKYFQIAFIWLFPGIGAGVLLAISRGSKSKENGTYQKSPTLECDPYVGLRNASKDYFQDGHHDD